MKILILILMLTAGTGIALRAQISSDPLKISVSGIQHNNQVKLRWVPQNFKTWKHGIVQGYVVERQTTAINGVPLSINDQLASTVVLLNQAKPAPESQWEIPAQTNDLMGVAAGMIFGDSLDVLIPGETNIATIQNLTQERDNRFGFSLFAADQDFNVALMMGLAYVDANVNPNAIYQYSVKPYQAPANATVLNGLCEVNMTQAYALPVLVNPVHQSNDKSILLNWDCNTAYYTSYRVSRSVAGAANWTVINQRPLISTNESGAISPTVLFRDTLPDNTSIFDYKVEGYSPFGLWSPALLINNLKGVPPPLNAAIQITGVIEQPASSLTIGWEFPSNLNGQITGFEIFRARHPDSTFVSLGSTGSSVRKFVDTAPLNVNYYQIGATDLNGYKILTFPVLGQLRDEVPPSAPGKPAGSCDNNGRVTLHWKKSASPDLMGYRVYASTSKYGDFLEVTSDWINDTLYAHDVNLKTLSSQMFYVVRAIDFHHNLSEPSLTGGVLRADIVPPAKPVITEISPLTSGVKLSFEKSTSTDVARYQLQRMKSDLPGWTTLFDLETNQTPPYFKDNTASKRFNYRYRLLAVDAAGNESSSNLVDAKPLNDGLRDALLSLTGIKAPNGYIKLQWGSVKDPDLTGYTIFRALQDSTKRRSFAFTPFPVPPPPTSTSPEAVVTGNLIAYTYWDTDLDFSVPVNTSYSGGSTANNNAATQNQGNGQYGSSNSNPPQPPTKIYYWIQAKYADGTFSPLKGPVKVNLN